MNQNDICFQDRRTPEQFLAPILEQLLNYPHLSKGKSNSNLFFPGAKALEALRSEVLLGPKRQTTTSEKIS